MSKIVSNCRTYLSEEDCQTLFSIIKGQYELETITPIQEEDAFNLYTNISWKMNESNHEKAMPRQR
jgi:hypothetical protein